MNVPEARESGLRLSALSGSSRGLGGTQMPRDFAVLIASLIPLVFGANSPAFSAPVMPVDGTVVPGFTIWDTHSATFHGSCASVPFSFTYGGIPFSSSWTLTASSSTSCTYLDPTRILEVRMDLTNYSDFDAAKWLLTFTNVSNSQNSQILSQVQPGNIQLIADQGMTGRFDIHYNVGALGEEPATDGSSAKPSAMPDFTPINNNPPKNGTLLLQSVNGRSSSKVLPYFNIESRLVVLALFLPLAGAANGVHN
jgi:hypothetical protein